MTTIQKHLRTLKANRNGKNRMMVLGSIRKEIGTWSLSSEAKQAAYRQVLRVVGYTDERHIAKLAEAYFG